MADLTMFGQMHRASTTQGRVPTGRILSRSHHHHRRPSLRQESTFYGYGPTATTITYTTEQPRIVPVNVLGTSGNVKYATAPTTSTSPFGTLTFRKEPTPQSEPVPTSEVFVSDQKQAPSKAVVAAITTTTAPLAPTTTPLETKKKKKRAIFDLSDDSPVVVSEPVSDAATPVRVDKTLVTTTPASTRIDTSGFPRQVGLIADGAHGVQLVLEMPHDGAHNAATPTTQQCAQVDVVRSATTVPELHPTPPPTTPLLASPRRSLLSGKIPRERKPRTAAASITTDASIVISQTDEKQYAFVGNVKPEITPTTPLSQQPRTQTTTPVIDLLTSVPTPFDQTFSTASAGSHCNGNLLVQHCWAADTTPLVVFSSRAKCESLQLASLHKFHITVDWCRYAHQRKQTTFDILKLDDESNATSPTTPLGTPCDDERVAGQRTITLLAHTRRLLNETDSDELDRNDLLVHVRDSQGKGLGPVRTFALDEAGELHLGLPCGVLLVQLHSRTANEQLFVEISLQPSTDEASNSSALCAFVSLEHRHVRAISGLFAPRASTTC